MSWVGSKRITEWRDWRVYVQAESEDEAREKIERGEGTYYAYTDSGEVSREPVRDLEDDRDIPGMGM